MLVANFTSRIPTMGNTKTFEDWSNYLGKKPYRYGVIARKYTDHTLTFITDGLRNMFYRGEGTDKYLPSNSMVIEWEVKTTNYVLAS